MENWADYKEMYMIMARASEQAINMLIDAQQKAEEIYLSTDENGQNILKIINEKINDEK